MVLNVIDAIEEKVGQKFGLSWGGLRATQDLGNSFYILTTEEVDNNKESSGGDFVVNMEVHNNEPYDTGIVELFRVVYDIDSNELIEGDEDALASFLDNGDFYPDAVEMPSSRKLN